LTRLYSNIFGSMMKTGDLVRLKRGLFGVVIKRLHIHTPHEAILVRLINKSFYGKCEWPYKEKDMELISESR
jgi:hypothetical protein